jgi:hypothetical protein
MHDIREWSSTPMTTFAYAPLTNPEPHIVLRRPQQRWPAVNALRLLALVNAGATRGNAQLVDRTAGILAARSLSPRATNHRRLPSGS